jgi:hypothetical protein
MIEIDIVKRDGSCHTALFSDNRGHIAYGYRWCYHKGYADAAHWEKGRNQWYSAHRLVLAEMEQEAGRVLETWQKADHKNRNPLDNRDENLRVASHRQNVFNTGIKKNNTSGHKGVRKKGDQWLPRLSHLGKEVSGRITRDEEEAIKAYSCMSLILQDPEYVCLEVPDVSFEQLWREIGAKQRNQVRRSLELNGFWIEERREMTGGFEDMIEPVGARKCRNAWQPIFKVSGGLILGKNTRDRFEAYKAYDCILYLLKNEKNRVPNFPSIPFEEKWEEIGEKQRSQILNSIEKRGLFCQKMLG